MTIWLTKLLLSHLLTDFLLQKSKWIANRNKNHFASRSLYIHTLITAGLAWLFIGWNYWLVAIIIFITHTIIDGLKSYTPDDPTYFLIDQALHLLVIFACWWFTFYDFSDLKINWKEISENTNLWIKFTAFFFVTWPCGYLVGQLTKKWRANLPDSEGLANAGKWIGILERIMILTLALFDQYESVGLLIAAKGIIRFNENNRTEQKTEYLVIGTLISLALAIATGLVVTELTGMNPNHLESK
jgi:hypothetical protein